jgi:hypothetical protein
VWRRVNPTSENLFLKVYSRREIGMYYHEGDNDDWYDESDYYDDEVNDDWEELCGLCKHPTTACDECDGCGLPLCYMHYSGGGCYCLRPNCDEYMYRATRQSWKDAVISGWYRAKEELVQFVSKKLIRDESDDIPF